jgi:hypothetical protein
MVLRFSGDGHGPPPDGAGGGGAHGQAGSNGDGAQEAEARTIWSFGSAGWRRARDPLGEGQGFEQMHKAAGFGWLGVLGDRDAPLRVDLYRHRDGRWLAWFWCLDDGFAVLLDDLPGLVGFLREVLPVVRTGAELGELQARSDERWPSGLTAARRRRR